MQVATKAYGLIEVDPSQEIRFSQGLLGFAPYKRYVLLDAERPPFYWLQSVDEVCIAFIVISPFLFRPDYELTINNEELLEIGLSDPHKALVFSILTIPQGGGMTANLQGPLVINRDTRLGMQAVLSDPRWNIKHDVMAELQAERTKRDQPC
ncbi:MAG: flagellar assembly protein FliW [Spirochaetaceae bacterium]|nr:flagellar assembly protein FliW [Spirochaetaceae bacterium]